MAFTFQDIVGLSLDDIEFIGNTECVFDNLSDIENANETSLVWMKGDVKDTKARVIVCDSRQRIPNKLLISTRNPKNVFTRIANGLFKKRETGIDETAKIINSTIGENAYVGAHVVIENSVIGDNVTIHHGAVIGRDGFGYSRGKDSTWHKFPHIGKVIIGDNVEVGSNSVIDRGALGNTVIGRNVKIDNLVHVAHNVIIGENTLVIANAMIGGSVRIGRNAWIAPSVSIINQVTIGDNAMVGIGSVVTKDIPDNEVWYGVPAKKQR